MAKTIAVWGSPNSGKTTFATKLARAIYDEYQSTVIVVYADMETPTLPVIFPNYKKEDLYSVVCIEYIIEMKKRKISCCRLDSRNCY